MIIPTISHPILDRSFFLRDALTVARLLLGTYLCRYYENERLVGKIVETEAYLGAEDLASHAARGKSRRNFSLWGEGGWTYVYSIHSRNCLDIVTQSYDIPTSVLIRAVEPIQGIDTMKKMRQVSHLPQLTNGPGKLCKAFSITRDDNAVDMCTFSSLICVVQGENVENGHIMTTPRIGISKAKEILGRFVLLSSPYLSR